ncbi:MAG TPA: dTDP-4-dehydrorhamnose 3,5-epimerase [Hyphomonadaceae bacterium]|jgi:dTDP-4-dehydrorhamnose 3,5-epimerase|nr:dTDP-4-dehydrorhamnose 3,5-epimerase [Hyphomonadaceae bacterium]
MIERLVIPEVLLITPKRFKDGRGWFSEAFKLAEAEVAGLPAFIQDNESFSTEAGVVRGLHFQTPPFAQAKLIRCVAGAILDVAVDIRTDSPTYGQHVAAELSAANGAQIFVPAGFAHGYCTLQPGCLIEYKVSSRYSPEHERGVLWNDTTLAIAWPVPPEDALITDRDRAFPGLAELPAYFS